MQKKAISMVFSLLLAFMGVARADVVTIGAGSGSNVYIPTRSYYNYSLTQQLYTADEIGTAGTINSIAFFNTGTEVTRNLTLYMVNTDKTVFSGNYDWITVSATDQVFNGSVTMTTGQWATITLDTPFVYDGTSNLAVVVDDNTGSYVNGADFLADNTTPSQALYIYSDGVNYDPFNPSNYSGTQPFMKNQIQLGFDGGSSVGDQLHVKYYNGAEEIVDELNLGVRPINAWMEPFNFVMYTEGQTYTVNVLDFTPSDGMFTVSGEELPFQVIRNNEVDLTLSTNATVAGVIERQFVAITEGNRAAHIWPVVVEMYDPQIPDVWEKACTEATTFPFVEVPATAHNTTLHNDYRIAPVNIEDGYDAVYKLVFNSDVMLNAEVSNGENGKVALFTEDFYGQGGPLVDNAYTGAMGVAPTTGGGELTVFDGTVTSGYVPVYGTFADYYQKSEYVMPAGVLSEMNGMDINSMTLYTSSQATQAWASTWTVFMKEIGATTIDDFQGNTGATVVYQGTLDGTAEEMTINFSMPYHYNGGNLLIGFYSLVPDMPYSSAYFYGETATGASVQGMNSSSLDGVSATQRNFVPKTTFVYGNRTDTPATPSPSMATANAAIEGMTVTPGTYYLVASSTTEDFEVTINREALPCPVAVSGDTRTPVDGATGLEPDAVELTWQLGEYTTAWRLVFGSTYYPQEGHPQTIITEWSTEPATSYTVRNLWNNTQYFWRIEEKNGNCPEGTASETWGFTTHLNVPHNLTVNDDQIFEGETVTLNWNAIQDRTYRQYRIYKDGQLIGSTPVNQVVTTFTVPANELTYNMTGYVFNVTAVYDEGESAFSNDVVVKVSGYSNNTGINGYVWEQDGTTGIGGAHVTITGTDEFGDEHVYNATTGNNGYYNVRVYVGHYTNAVATLDGYQETTTVHELPFDVALNGQEDDVNFIMDENFDPVCAVIAEYYPDSLDPESPYVKVYWGCGFTPDAIIEDFETGDFSMFDWQLDGAYPWSITTNQPYEGQYCMKSGGAGVQSVTSDMSVTVEIPANGKMSFFGKISSEQNWDYGYFYIDGQQMGAYTGLSGWGEKQFNITEGTHTFRWSYQKDGSVDANEDCFYVDYVNFYFQPEPAQPGWVYYDDGTVVDAIGTTDGSAFYWGVMFPAGSYAGNTVSKVSVYDYSAFNGQVQVYQGGNTAPQGSALYTQNVTFTGAEDFQEITLTTPVAIDPAQNLWIVMYKQSGETYVAAGCANTGDPNGRWISLDGTTWEDVASYGLDYTWMIRAYVANGAKGEMLTAGRNSNVVLAEAPAIKAPVRVKGETPKSVFAASGNAMKHEVGVPERSGATRSLHHYNIYRTHCYNDGPYTAENTVLLATNWPGDTIYIDVEWADLEPGIYKWGVGCVYAGNRGELQESEIAWGAPMDITRANGDRTGKVENTMALQAYNGTMVETNGNHASNFRGNTGYASVPYSSNANIPTGFISFDVDDFTSANSLNASLSSLRGATYNPVNGHIYASETGTYNFDEIDPATGSIISQANPGLTYLGLAYDVTTGTMYCLDTYNYFGTVDMSTGEMTDIDELSASIGCICADANGMIYGLEFGSPANLYTIDKTTGNCTLVGSTGMNANYAQSFNFDHSNGKLYWCQFYNGNSSFCEINPTTGVATTLVSNIGEVCGMTIPTTAGPTPPTPPTPTPGSNLNELAEPRESETIWSNCLEKGMYLGEGLVDINVLLNSADSPEGTTVSFTNLNEFEQAEHPMEAITLDETGFYSWDLFRKGDYIVTIEDEGYYSITDTVSIWSETHMRYVMTEIIYGVKDLYVSRTGWAMWNPNGEPSNNGDEGRHLEYFKVMCTSIDGEPIFNDNTVYPFCQVATDELVEGDYYICKVAAVYSTGMSDWTECLWQYESCEHYAGTVNGIEVDGTTVNWEYPTGGVTPPVPPVPGDVAEIVLNVPSDIWGDGSGYQMLLDADATMYAQLAAVNYFDELGSFDGFEYTIPENADYGINPTNIVISNSVAIEVPAGTYDYAIINPDKVSTIWFAAAGNVESKGDDMVYEAGKRYTYTVTSSGTGDAVNLTITDRNGRTYQPAMQSNHIAYVVRTKGNREGEWFFYDNGNYSNVALGLSNSGTGEQFPFQFGIMFPAGSYQGNSMTKVAFFDAAANTGTIEVYQGGSNAPGTMVYSEAYSTTGAEDFVELTFTSPVAVDATQNLWVIINTNGGYVAALDNQAGNANGMWIYSDLLSPDWQTVVQATSGAYNGNWMIRAYIEAGSGPNPQPGDSNVIGAMVFLNGEWEAFVPYPTNSYTFDQAGDYCVRMVYDGTAELPDNNYYYAMSCEECTEAPACESDIEIHGEALTTTDQSKIWWGEQPAMDEWFTYDPEELQFVGGVGVDSTGSIPYTIGCMYPAAMLADYVGGYIDEVAYLDGGEPDMAGNIEIQIYLGGDGQPGTLVSSTPAVIAGNEPALVSTVLDTPVLIDGTQNVWVMFYCPAFEGPVAMPLIEDCGDPNSGWLGAMGMWFTLNGQGIPYSFAEIVHVGGGAKSGYIANNDQIGGQAQFEMGNRSGNLNVFPVEPKSFNIDRLTNRYDSEVVKYNIYRSTEATSGYELIGSLDYVEGQTYYEYIDTPATSNDYYYRVRTVYADGCESMPALNADNYDEDYVLIAVNVGVNENDSKVNLFPNPTNGNVTIQAEGMSHITVVSVLGQIVYDVDVNADEAILNMAQFNAGMYMVRINTENGVVVKRVTVMQ